MSKVLVHHLGNQASDGKQQQTRRETPNSVLRDETSKRQSVQKLKSVHKLSACNGCEHMSEER